VGARDRDRASRRGVQTDPRRDRRRDGPHRRPRGGGGGDPPPRGRRGRRRAVLDHLALRHEGGHPRGRTGLDREPRGGAHPGDRPSAWADELGDWLVDQVTGEREIAVALYRLQVELLDSASAAEVHHDWGEGLRTVGERVLTHSATATPDLDVRLIVAALDGLRMGVLSTGEQDVEWLRLAVRRQLQALLG
jgi:hypothetical protein